MNLSVAIDACPICNAMSGFDRITYRDGDSALTCPALKCRRCRAIHLDESAATTSAEAALVRRMLARRARFLAQR